MHLTSLMIVLCPFLKEFNVAKKKRRVQRVRTVVPHSVNPELMRSQLDSSLFLTRQSKSYPGGQPRLARTPSVSSQSSLDSSISRQVNNIEIIWACSSHGGTD